METNFVVMTYSTKSEKFLACHFFETIKKAMVFVEENLEDDAEFNGKFKYAIIKQKSQSLSLPEIEHIMQNDNSHVFYI